MTDLAAEPSASTCIFAELDEAARVIGALWPLGTAIAVNPLWDLRQLAFQDAVALAYRAYGSPCYPAATLFEQAYDAGRIEDSDLVEALEHAERARRVELSPTGNSIVEHFHSASLIMTPAEHFDSIHGTSMADEIDERVAAWCAAFAGGVLAQGASRGFFPAWRAAVRRDPRVRRRFGPAGIDTVESLGPDAPAAVERCLAGLGVEGDRRVAVLAAHLARLPGWAGYAKWQSCWAPQGHGAPALGLVDYIAVRLSTEMVLLASCAPGSNPARAQRPPRRLPSTRVPDPAIVVPDLLSPEIAARLARMTPAQAAEVWLLAYEAHWRSELLDHLDRREVERAGSPTAAKQCRPMAQAVFCIDVRSEGIRRHVEEMGEYETLGFAGFFSLAMRFHPWGAEDAVDACPVLLQPTTDMTEQPTVDVGEDAWRFVAGKQARAAFDEARKAAHHGSMAPFILAEAGGFAAGIVAIARTVAPRASKRVGKWIDHLIAPPVATSINADPASGASSDDDQALFAESALVAMGLVDGFAPIIVLCGHGATSENNPYASAIDCGACGGNRGAASARAAVAILNRSEVRNLLARRGIAIPGDTWFVAAEHDTVTDEIVLLDRHLVPPAWQALLAQIADDLVVAGRRAASERMASLPGPSSRGARSARMRAADWAQVRPEWGLAGNAAFVVGRRSLTAGVDLQRRVFLHSYDAAVDPDGRALETILTAPMVVAHWINAQYYFSAVAPEVFSSGDKTVHNVVASIGVVRGAGGDLGVGLPLQAVFDGDRLYHEPMRLLVIVEAPRDRIDEVVARNQVLKDLFDGRWVHLVGHDGPGHAWFIRHPGGEWALHGTRRF